MKRAIRSVLAVCLFFWGAVQAEAVDFRLQGEMVFGTGFLNSAFIREKNGEATEAASDDKFATLQRLRMQMEAIASENLSSLLCLEVGDNLWGSVNAFGGGAALGTDGTFVKVRHAFVDWALPDTSLKMRIGLQTIPAPHAAGGSSILNNEAAAFVASYRVSDNVAVTGTWVRPYNDNYTPVDDPEGTSANLRDNVDLFMLSVPINWDGWQITPWGMAGMLGVNTFKGDEKQYNLKSGILYLNVLPYTYLTAENNQNMGRRFEDRSYGALFFAGLPIVVTAFSPLRVEADFNYGYSQGIGHYEITDFRDHITQLADTRRTGWLAKALVEYEMDRGTPGVFGWYASGDDGNVRNGSERMPAISPCGNFTSFVGDDPTGFGMLVSGQNATYDLQLNYAGTWGLGVQIKDITFAEDLTHTLRVVRWGGTNSPAMIKYMASTDGAYNRMSYLTEHDSMIEFNVDSVYKFSENLSAHIQLGYVINQMDMDEWNREYRGDSLKTGDAYKASAMLYYKF